MCISTTSRRRPVATTLPTGAFRPQQITSSVPTAAPLKSAAPATCLPQPHQQPQQQQQQQQQHPHEQPHKPEHHVVHVYHDHAADPKDNTKYATRGGVTTPFPLKLHSMLDRIEADGLAHVVSWQPHGRCFVVHKPKEFVDHVMPKYFKQSKFASFQRQLNLYGFNRITSGMDRGGYYHELFLRNKVFLCHRIHRMRVKGTGVRMASSPETEPNFYALPPVGIRLPHPGAAAAYMKEVPQKTLPRVQAASSPVPSSSPAPSASASPIPAPVLSSSSGSSPRSQPQPSQAQPRPQPRPPNQAQAPVQCARTQPVQARAAAPVGAPVRQPVPPARARPQQPSPPRTPPTPPQPRIELPVIPKMTCVYYPPSATTASIKEEEEGTDYTEPLTSTTHSSRSDVMYEEDEGELDEVEFEGRVFHYLAPFHDDVSQIVKPPSSSPPFSSCARSVPFQVPVSSSSSSYYDSSGPRLVKPDLEPIPVVWPSSSSAALSRSPTPSEKSVAFFSRPPEPNAPALAMSDDRGPTTVTKAVVSDDDDDEEEETTTAASSSVVKDNKKKSDEKSEEEMDAFIASLDLPFSLNDTEMEDCLGDDTSFGLMLEKIIE